MAQRFTYGGKQMENVESCLYLNSEFTWNNDCSKDIDTMERYTYIIIIVIIIIIRTFVTR